MNAWMDRWAVGVSFEGHTEWVLKKINAREKLPFVVFQKEIPSGKNIVSIALYKLIWLRKGLNNSPSRITYHTVLFSNLPKDYIEKTKQLLPGSGIIHKDKNAEIEYSLDHNKKPHIYVAFPNITKELLRK